MPSVRQFAKCNGISTFTVVESYDRLVTLGLLSSRRGSGYFVARQDVPATLLPSMLQVTPTAIDALTPDLYSGTSDALAVGAGWLPPEWYGEDTILDAVRHAMRIPANRLRGYGHPLGFPSLRQQLSATLSDELFPVEPEQVLLTHGATHAFDLILRTLTKPGDTVFVEDPGYSNLLSLIRHHGCVAVGIPRGENGLDFDALARQAALTQPKLMFVNTVLQNPLGTSLSVAQAHRLLGVAEQFDFWLVEDDIYRELAPRGEASLAAMDGLRRVIRVGSFSKTLVAGAAGGFNLRLGLADPRAAAREDAGRADHLRDQRARRLSRHHGAALQAHGGKADRPAGGRPRTRYRQPAQRRHGAAGQAARRHVRQRRLERPHPAPNGTARSSPTWRSSPASCCRRAISSCCARRNRSGSASTWPTPIILNS